MIPPYDAVPSQSLTGTIDILDHCALQEEMSLIDTRFSHADPATTLQLTQQAPALLARAGSGSTSTPLSLFTSSDKPETWTDLEKLVIACLQSGDDKSAHFALERLTQRFGKNDEKIMALRGLYQEAVAKDYQDLRKIVEDYNTILRENPVNVPILKRRIAILRTLKHEDDAAAALVDFLDSFPADAEAWAELADVYWKQGLSAQAIFCLEESLLGAPNAWNIHAQLGEFELLSASTDSESIDSRRRLLSNSIRRFARSVELCDDYLRGYYGLLSATRKYLQIGENTKSSNGDTSIASAQRLQEMATRKLKAMVAQWTKDPDRARDNSEIIAVRQLIDGAT